MRVIAYNLGLTNSLILFSYTHQILLKLLLKCCHSYTSALREVANLRKLRHRGWKGIPELYGACVRARGITYIVSHVPGRPFCQGSGVDQGCAMAHDVKSYLMGRENPELLVMTWITKVRTNDDVIIKR